MIEPERLLGMEFLGNTVLAWLFAVAAFFVTFTVLPIVRGYLSALRKRRPPSEHEFIDVALVVASRTTRLFLVAVAIWVGSLPLQLSARVEKLENGAMLVLLWIQVGLWAMAVVKFLLDRRRGIQADRGLAGSFDIIHFVLRLLIWTLVLLFALDNLGVQVTTLIAGLGIGGIAVALAVQNVLGDLFASLSITLDKPFVVGDFLAIDKDMGTVERIGVKSTRLRSLEGDQIIVSNADLLKSRVHNYGRMYERRVAFTISVRYEIPLQTVKEIPQILAGIVREQQKVRFDRSHFARYGDFALLYEVVYYVLSPDFNLYMDIQQAINLRIFEEFGTRGIVFSYRERQLAPVPEKE